MTWLALKIEVHSSALASTLSDQSHIRMISVSSDPNNLRPKIKISCDRADVFQVPIGGEEAATELAVVGTPREFDFAVR